MKDGIENIDQLFRENLDDYSQTPPEEVWSRIEQSLLRNRKKTVWPLYFRIAASIVLLAGITTLAWKYLDKDNEILISDTQNPVIEQESAGIVLPNDNEFAADQQVSVVPVKKKDEINANKGGAVPNYPVVERDAVFPADADQQLVAMQIEEPIAIAEPESLTLPVDATQPALTEQEKPTISQEKPVNVSVSNDLIIQQNLLSLDQQNGNSGEERPVVWSVGGEAGPQYSYRDVNVNSSSLPGDFYNQYEKGVIAYAGGVNIEMEPANRFSIQSGVFYSKIGQIKNNVQLDDRGQIGEVWFNPSVVYQPGTRATDVVNSTGNITFDKNLTAPMTDIENDLWEPGIITAEQYFEFIEVPFVCSYKIIDRKWDIDLSSGIWANFLVGNKAYATDNETFSIEGETEDINKFNYSASLAIGFAYPIGKSLNISMQPLFKYYLMPINSNPQTEVYPYSLSLMTGIQYTF